MRGLGVMYMAGPQRDRSASVPHVFTEAENVGGFTVMGKITWFQPYMKAAMGTVGALVKLTQAGALTQEVKDILAAYCPKGIHVGCILGLRWHLLCKRLSENKKLLPTVNWCPWEYIECVQVQIRVIPSQCHAARVFRSP